MKMKRMEIRDIPCNNCHKTIMVTPMSRNVRCHFCNAVNSIEACENVQKGPSCLCWKVQIPAERRQDDALLVPDQKANAMTCTAAHQPKRAVLCGVSYHQKRKHRLKGTINDVNRMKSLLVNQFCFPEKAIRVLTEENNDPNFTPTKENMQKALKWLVADCKSGDSLVFYFSGHGSRQPDFDGDEIDGFDETICPTDFMTAGIILDNDINTTIVKPLKEGVKLHAIIDACHSGTILDLEHVYSNKLKRWEDNKPPSGVSKSTDGGLAISLSACADDQMAADTSAFSGNEMTGAMTYILVHTIADNPGITYGRLLSEMHKKIEDANKTGCHNIPFLRKLFHKKLKQDTQLSSSKEFDVDTEVFKL